MIQTMPLSQQKEMEESGSVYIAVKKGWEPFPWNSTPFLIYYTAAGAGREEIFACYIHSYNNMMTITDLVCSEWLESQNNLALTDFMAGLAVTTMKAYAKGNFCRVLFVSTKLPFFIDHFVNNGFKIEPSPTMLGTHDSKEDRIYRARFFWRGKK